MTERVQPRTPGLRRRIREGPHVRAAAAATNPDDVTGRRIETLARGLSGLRRDVPALRQGRGPLEAMPFTPPPVALDRAAKKRPVDRRKPHFDPGTKRQDITP